MSQGGSCDRTAEIAARALLDLGCTRLQVKIGAHVAAFGGACWQTDRALVEAFASNGGHVYHRESVGRARRQLAQANILRSKRVFTGQRPTSKAMPSPHGTTVKRIRWDRLGVVDPGPRRDAAIERNARSKRQRAELAKRIEAAGRAKYSAPVPEQNYATQPPVVDPDLQAELDRFVRLQSERVARVTSDQVGQNMSDRPPHGPGPPKGG
jgi:hypothetical protein